MQKNDDFKKSLMLAEDSVFMSESLQKIIPVYNNPIRVNIIQTDKNVIKDIQVLSLDKTNKKIKLVLLINKENITEAILDIQCVELIFNNKVVKELRNVKQVKFVKENDNYIVKAKLSWS